LGNKVLRVPKTSSALVTAASVERQELGAVDLARL
jgi:hypothetical protein